jgi:hypothetical protein
MPPCRLLQINKCYRTSRATTSTTSAAYRIPKHRACCDYSSSEQHLLLFLTVVRLLSGYLHIIRPPLWTPLHYFYQLQRSYPRSTYFEACCFLLYMSIYTASSPKLSAEAPGWLLGRSLRLLLRLAGEELVELDTLPSSLPRSSGSSLTFALGLT